MGWTGQEISRPKDYLNFFVEEFSDVKFLDFARKGGTCYAVVEFNGKVHGLVILTSYRRGEFLYKMMGEESGPVESNPPKRILDMLDRLVPNPTGYALEWRERSRKNLTSGSTPKHGDIIRFDYKLDFTHNCGSEDTFRVIKQGRKTRFQMYNSGLIVRISHFRKRNFTILTQGEV